MYIKSVLIEYNLWECNKMKTTQYSNACLFFVSFETITVIWPY